MASGARVLLRRRRHGAGNDSLAAAWQAATLAISFFTTQTQLKTRRTQVNHRILQLVLAIVSPVILGWFAEFIVGPDYSRPGYGPVEYGR